MLSAPDGGFRTIQGQSHGKEVFEMRDYEVIFIAHPDLDETALAAIVEKVKGWIIDAGGTVTKADVWGKKRMSHTIRKQRDGQYVYIKANMMPSSCSELERNLRFLEPVLRFLIVAVE
jgi:small subunit ribosomal protein S6